METNLIRRNNKTSINDDDGNRTFRFINPDRVQDEKKGGFQDLRLSRPMCTHLETDSPLVFWVVLLCSQVVGLTCIGLVIYWCHLYGGFAWESNADQQFLWHPFLMVLGLIFCFGDSIIIYRALSFLPKWILKLVHGAIHVCAIVASSVGLAAVLLNHKRKGKADFYSLHSWIGIGTFSLFVLQYVLGFMAFLLPGFSPFWRATILPFHTYFGIALFAMAVGTAQMGITEWLLWTGNYTKGYYPIEGIVGNSLGVCLVVFALFITFIVTHGGFKRKPLPGEVPQMTKD